jgi:hypothetical protein
MMAPYSRTFGRAMNTALTSPQDTDFLTELQLQVARRADQLAAILSYRTSLNLPCWLQAEEEVLGALRGVRAAEKGKIAKAPDSRLTDTAYWPA